MNTFKFDAGHMSRTIHDSVVTLMAYRRRIEQIMEEEIETAIGFKPSFGEGW